MSDYQVFARKYRPQKFADVIGQDNIVKTLRHAIAYKRLGHAYIFSGPHGTGKTSVARLFAKALNCKDLSSDYEPCDRCSSCLEIRGSYSLDVLEIDGASHRGIEDIRKLNETIAYAPATGFFKIYLIDEVHMLTKEAFNALLKSLEEPPSHVKFFFATTEAHLIPATIVSRCQRFNFKPLSIEKISEKLEKISEELSIQVDKEALHCLAHLAQGGMRDAESLFDELASFQKEKIDIQTVKDFFGLPDEELFATLDRAYIEKDYAKGFTIVQDLLSSGKNISYFLDALTNHFRNSLLDKKGTYTQEQLLEILEIMTPAHQEFKLSSSKKIFLELLLLRILRTGQKVNLENLVARLQKMEERLSQSGNEKATFVSSSEKMAPLPSNPPPTKSPINLIDKNRVDTLVRFAAKELNGSLKRKEES